MVRRDAPYGVPRLLVKVSCGSGGDELGGEAVVGSLLAGREGDLFVGGEVSFCLMVGDMAVEAEEEVVGSAEGPKSVEVFGEGPIVEMALEAGHSTELSAVFQTRLDDAVGERFRKDAAGKQLGPVAVIGVGGVACARGAGGFLSRFNSWGEPPFVGIGGPCCSNGPQRIGLQVVGDFRGGFRVLWWETRFCVCRVSSRIAVP